MMRQAEILPIVAVVATLSALVTIWLDLRRRRLPLFSLSTSFSLVYFDILVTGLAVGLAIWNAASFPFESARETPVHALAAVLLVAMSRSEERRVGKECR